VVDLLRGAVALLSSALPSEFSGQGFEPTATLFPVLPSSHR